MGEDIIPLNFDLVFKRVFGSNENINILETFISIYFDIPLEKIKGKVVVLNSEKRLINKSDKEQESDIIARIVVDNDSISLNLEMNRVISQGIIDRNLDYLTGIFYQGLKKNEKYDNMPTSIQVNFNLREIDSSNTKIIDKYYMQNDNGYHLTKKFCSHQVNIERCYKIWYDKTIKKYNTYEQQIIRLGALMYITKKTEFISCLEEIVMDEKVKSDIEDIMLDINSDDFINMYYDREQHEKLVQDTLISDARKEGKEEGIEIGTKHEKLEIAKKMLEKNSDIKFICECTGLTEEELTNLK